MPAARPTLTPDDRRVMQKILVEFEVDLARAIAEKHHGIVAVHLRDGRPVVIEAKRTRELRLPSPKAGRSA